MPVAQPEAGDRLLEEHCVNAGSNTKLHKKSVCNLRNCLFLHSAALQAAADYPTHTSSAV